MLVMIAVIVAATVAYSYLGTQSTSILIARNVRDHAKARFVAETGLELTIEYIRDNPDWRTDQSQGTWVTNEAFGEGTFTVVVEDGADADGDGAISIPSEGDGDLADDAQDLLTLTVTGSFGGASHRVQAVAQSRIGVDDGADEHQVATQVTIEADCTLTSITAYVKGPPPKKLRYAVYTDAGGEPGALIVQTATAPIGSNSFYWHSIDTPPTPLTAGTYWLALSFDFLNMFYAYENTGGQTRYNDNDAVKDGYSAAWGASSASNNWRVRIFATCGAGGGPGGDSDLDVDWR